MRKEAISQLAARLTIDARTSPAAAGLVRSMTKIVAAAEAFDAAAKDLRTDPNWSETGRRNQLSKLYQAHAAHIQHAEGAIETAKSHINTRRAAMMEPKRDPSDTVGELRRQELRAFIRSLPPGERMKAAFDDPAIADAVADAHPALSGLTTEQVEHARQRVFDAHPEAADLAAIEEAIVAVDAAAVMFRDMMREAGVDMPAQTAA